MYQQEATRARVRGMRLLGAPWEDRPRQLAAAPLSVANRGGAERVAPSETSA